MKKLLLYILIVFLPTTFASCSSRRINKDMSSPEDPQIATGRLVFKYNCQKCHPNGEAGVGPELNSLRLPKFAIRARVRSRAFLLWTGRMPAFKKHEISKKELNDLVAYVKDLEKKDKNVKAGKKY
jgi:mono/diheme cytochrome c family protein